MFTSCSFVMCLLLIMRVILCSLTIRTAISDCCELTFSQLNLLMFYFILPPLPPKTTTKNKNKTQKNNNNKTTTTRTYNSLVKLYLLTHRTINNQYNNRSYLHYTKYILHCCEQCSRAVTGVVASALLIIENFASLVAWFD